MFREMLKNFLIGYSRGAIAQLEYEIRVKKAKIKLVKKIMFPLTELDKAEKD